MAANEKTHTLAAAAIAAFAIVFAVTAGAAGLAGATAACKLCEPSGSLKKDVTVPIPEHAILLDMGNGVFWRNSRLIVVDLDQSEARTYRFPPDKEKPTSLVLVGTKAVDPEAKREMIREANVFWSPPPLESPPQLLTDVFETVYVVNGATMVRSLRLSNDPAWYTKLEKSILAVEAQ